MTATHRETHDSIPWIVTGAIGAEERREFDAHIADCAECQSELQLQQRVYHAMANADKDERIEYTPGASLQKLWKRIDGPEDAVLDPQPPPRRSHNRLVPWLIAAVLVEAIGITLLGVSHWDRPAEYRTVTTSAPNVAGDMRAVFAADMSLGQLNALLRSESLTIVQGPTAAGVYTLAATTTIDKAAALTHLRNHPSVRFVEQLDDAH